EQGPAFPGRAQAIAPEWKPRRALPFQVPAWAERPAWEYQASRQSSPASLSAEAGSPEAV
ncbi:MAG: hypothetical protein ABI823_05800, partial [Bryobacteraceae bacterium]